MPGYSFPEDVLEHVFSFVTSDKDRNAVSLVCKSWYEIERWCRKRIFIGNCYAVSPGIVIRRFPDVKSVELKGKPHFADFNLVPDGWGGYVYPWIVEFSRAYPWLEEIRLKRMVVTDESLELISKSFKSFKVLVLSSCEGFSTDGLAAVAANCRNLRVLDLRESEVEDLSGHWLSHFPDTFTSLESLNIACLSSEVSFSALERLVARSPNLKTLKLNRAVPLDKLSTLLHRAPHLVSFGTGSYSAETRPDTYPSLSKAFSNSKHLKDLSGFWDASPSYLPAIYPVCCNLTSLNLSYSTIQSPEITKIITQCPNLNRLLVLDYIEDSGLNALATSCKNLQELRVFPSEPYVMIANVSLTEQGLVSVCEGCPKLHSILFFCRQMSNSALITISKSRPNLTCFRLCIIEPQAPDYLTFEPLDSGFGSIVQHCKNLTRLSTSSPLILRCILRCPPPSTTITPILRLFNRAPSIFLQTPSLPISRATLSSLTPRCLSTSTSPAIQPPISDEEDTESDAESEAEIHDNHPTETAIVTPVDPKISSAHKEMLSKLKGMSMKEKKELGSYANSLGKKLISQQVGKSGVTDSVATALVETLEANELLKLKIHNNCPGELDEVVARLEEATGSVVVGRIGRTVIVYRPSLTKLISEEKKKQNMKVFLKRRAAFKASYQGKMLSRSQSSTPSTRKVYRKA